jgi:SNF2 family DNA or RNA helicase
MLSKPLRPYQEEAVDKALDRGNLLIAYGMGTGKTPIQLAICEELIGLEMVSLNALVVPGGLKWQWAQQIAAWTDVEHHKIKMKDVTITVPVDAQCMVISGTPKKREEKYRYAIKYRPDYVILGYENVVNDWQWVKQLEPDLISLDEGSAIKTFKAQRTKQIKRWDAPYRYVLTGTPIDNRPEELYSIMEWLDPEVLGRYDIFDRAYIVRNHWGGVARYKNLDVLHKILQPAYIRKTRFDPDVSPYMPKDFHKEVYVSTSTKVWKLYKRIAAELIEDLKEIRGNTFDVAAYYSGVGDYGDEAQGKIMAKVGVLNMLCDHPRLVAISARKFDDYLHGKTGSDSGSKYAWELWKEGALEGLNTSPKLDQVVADVKDLLEENPKTKVMIFSFYKGMLEIMADAFKTGYVIYNGDMSITEKEAAKTKFQRNSDVRVFLSSDAGGMGLDFPQANYLVNYDLPWSAGKMDQRNSRHIRASSEWDAVWILNYIVESSLEERTFKILELKRDVGSAILDGTSKGGVVVNDVQSLKDALKDAI